MAGKKKNPKRKIIPRELSSALLQSARKFRITSLTGPRQSGKTTLLKNLFPKKKYVNFEQTDLRDFALSDPRGFLESIRKHKNGVILDEVQRVPSLFSYIQVIVDEDQVPGQFILSGSQNFLLLREISQSLAGRVQVFNLLPFNKPELEKYPKKTMDLNKILWQGSYPPIWDQRLEARAWLQSYLETYIERDVRQLLNIGDLQSFRTFLKMCAARSGELLNLSSLGNDCGITHNTAKNWLSVLQTSFIIQLVQPYFKNYGKRLVKTPKLFFLDTGLLCSLLSISRPEDLTFHERRGAIFETWVISETSKRILNLGRRPEMYFWRDRAGHEVDLLIPRKGKLLPIEVKAGKTLHPEHFKNLDWFLNNVSDASKKSLLVYAGKETKEMFQSQTVSWQDFHEFLE